MYYRLHAYGITFQYILIYFKLFETANPPFSYMSGATILVALHPFQCGPPNINNVFFSHKKTHLFSSLIVLAFLEYFICLLNYCFHSFFRTEIMFHTSLTSSISQVIKVTLIHIEFNKEEASSIKNLKQKLF